MFDHCAVVIPAYNPDNELIPYITKLQTRGMRNVIIVDDGSLESTQPIFKQLQQDPFCTVLFHPVNQGKGRAMKSAFQYIQNNCPEVRYIVTADADGQHLTEDVLAIFAYLQTVPSGVVLGSRNFDEEHVPSKNAFGNKLTSRVFQLLFGKRIIDTQTGLRGFRVAELDWLLPLKGERFEYEMNMLMYAVHKEIPLYEVPIETVYFGKKPPTHYKTFRDSFRIAKQLAIGLVGKKRLLEKAAVKGGE